jgi:hypothetical protein
MALTYNESLYSFDLVIFDFRNKSKENIVCSDEFIKKCRACDDEGIAQMYYESIGYEVDRFGKSRKSPIGFPDLIIKKDNEKRGVEVKQWGNLRGVKDTIKFHQLDYFFENKSIVLFVVYRDIPYNLDLRY